jgi:hypothetical protein
VTLSFYQEHRSAALSRAYRGIVAKLSQVGNFRGLLPRGYVRARQAHGEAASLPDGAFRRHRAAHRLGHFFHQREAQPCAAAVLGARAFRAVEALPDARQFVRRDALPGVLDLNDNRSIFRLGADRRSAGQGVPAAVAQQVMEDLL